MPYLLLIVEPVGQRTERTREAGEALYAQMKHFAAGLKERGILETAEALKSTTEAVRVEKRDGRKRLIDGPFAEAKEMIGGFFLLNCDTRAEAVEIAAACPAAEFASVEVRELGPSFL